MDDLAIWMALVLVSAGLAGCVGGDDDPGEQTAPSSADDSTATNDSAAASTASQPEANDTGPHLAVSEHSGTIDGGDVEPFPGGYCNPQGTCEDDFTFEIRENATAVLIEVAWNESQTMDMDASPPSEYCEDIDPAGLLISCPSPIVVNGESPLRIEITDEEQLNYTGEWFVDLDIESETPATVEWTGYVTHVSEGPLPDGYSNVAG